MENLFLFLFFTLITSVPFLYRFIRIGEIGWFVNRKSNSKIDKNYKGAEKLRIFQVVLGAVFFVIHGAIHKAKKKLNCVMHTHSRVGLAISCLKMGL